MHWNYPIRILSDLHYGHPLGRIRSPADLVPLFEGVSTVVFNGDTVEPFLARGPREARVRLEMIAARVRAAGANPFFISGNHDPEETPITHADMLGGLLHVTHGDVLFDEIAPWGADGEQLAELRREAMLAHPFATRDDLSRQLLATRQAVQKLHHHLGRQRARGPLTFLMRRVFWFPKRFLGAFRAWGETPELARRYLRQFRPHARFLVMGHTHRPGVRFGGRRIVLNTGSFQVGLGSAYVDVSPEEISIGSIGYSRGGWRPKTPSRRFRVDDYPLLSGAVGSEALN